MRDRVVQSHTSDTNHNLYLRPGDASTVELYCGKCGDFQYSSLFDCSVGKKRDYSNCFNSEPKAISTSNVQITSESTLTTNTANDNKNRFKRALRHRTKPSRGICNMGATCFMSVVLQIIFHMSLITSSPQMQPSFLTEYVCSKSSSQNKSSAGANEWYVIAVILRQLIYLIMQ